MPHLFRLSPSDLTFLWDECKRCFYLKVVHGFGRPQAPFPKIFSRIDRLMNHFYMGKSSAYIRPDLPPGRIEYGKRLVTSRPTRVEEGSTAAVIRGRFDTVIAYVGEVSWIEMPKDEPGFLRFLREVLEVAGSVVTRWAWPVLLMLQQALGRRPLSSLAEAGSAAGRSYSGGEASSIAWARSWAGSHDSHATYSRIRTQPLTTASSSTSEI